MTSEVEICNIALGNLRSGSINSLTEQSIQAQNCRLKYPILRDKCLTEIPWSFNHSIRVLSLVDTDIFNWLYAYQYPNDCLKINRLISPYEKVSDTGYTSKRFDESVKPLPSISYSVFNFENNKVIGTSQEEARIDYCVKVSDPNLFTADFIMMLSYLLSAELAIPILGGELGRAMRLESMQLYNQYKNTAMADSLNEQSSESIESEFVTIRN